MTGKILGALSLVLSVCETAVGAKWLAEARDHEWDPKRIFFGAVWLLHAVMQLVMACDLLSEDDEEEDVEYVDADWEEFDDDED